MMPVPRELGAPSMPSPEELETRAAAAVATTEGCWWVTAQASVHLLRSPVRRDPQSGEVLPQPLGDVLEGMARVAEVSTRPLPADTIQFASEFLAEPLRQILHQARSKIVRAHVQQPFHQLRDMDATCMNWLGRLPGRNVREKLAGRTSALGVVREFSLDTHENRVVFRVARMLGELVGWRLGAIANGAYDEAPRMREILELCHELCVEDLRRSPLAEVGLSLHPEPNNVLLRERNYSRIWRAWLRLKRLAEEMEWLWEKSETRFRTAVFWALVARLAQLPGVHLGDCLCRIISGFGTEAGIEALTVHDDAATWSLLPSVSLVLEPMFPSPRHRLGTITRLTANERGPFGFLRADDGGSYFLHPTALADTVSWDELLEGMKIAFIPGTPRGRGRWTREAAPPAEDIALPIPVSLLRLALGEGEIEMALMSLEGDLLLYPVPEAARVRRYSLRLDPTRLRPRRGVGLAVEVTEDGEGSRRLAATADIGGVRPLLDEIVASVAPGPPVHPLVTRSTRPSKATANRIGLDLAGPRPVASLDGEPIDLPSMLFAIQYPLDVEGTAEWVVPRAGRWTEILSIQWPVVGLLDLFKPAANSAEPAEAAKRILERLRDDLGVMGARADLRCAFAVPDAVDEWSQGVLRSAASGAARGSLPIWRSVAAALGWQETGDAEAAALRPGDVVIVLDAAGSGLCATFLIARHDEGLERQLAETRGIYWERRASLTPTALPEDLAEQAVSLTNEALQREYLAECLATGPDAGALADGWREVFLDRLVRTGVIERVVEERRPAWLPMGTSEVPAVLHIPFDSSLWARVTRSWADRLRTFLGELTSNELFLELLESTLGEGRSTLLLAGGPFHLGDVRNALTASPLPSAVRRFRLLLRGDADRLVATGAAHFLVRLQRNLPSWRDWLPELYLEVVRDGHFHELQLMGEHLLETEATAGTLGQGFTIEVEELLLLPAGLNQYAFPLQVGRRRDRLPFDAFLADQTFPLPASVEVRLELTYRYGLESAYDLAVVPVSASAPFKRLEVAWSPRAASQSEIPAFPRRRWWRSEQVEQSREWFLAKAKDFAQKSEVFFGPVDATRQRQQFALAMVARWNESLAEDDAWPEPATVGEELTVFAEWMRRSLEFPMRVLWDAGGGTVTDEDVNDAVHSDLVPWLVSLAGLEGELVLPAWYEEGAEAGLLDVEGSALNLLSRLQKDAPDNLLAALAGRLPTTTLDTLGGHATLDAVVFALRDGKGAQRKECLRALLTEVRRALTDSARDPDREGSLLWVLSRALWRHQHLVFTLADEHRWFLPWFIEGIEARYRADLASLLANPTPEVVSNIHWHFGLLAEILLGLFRLRQDDYFATRILAAGSARLLRIARLVRRIDGVLAMRGVAVMSFLRLSGRRPDSLFRMSELAFALNAFLTGEAGSNLIQIVSLEDDEEGQS